MVAATTVTGDTGTDSEGHASPPPTASVDADRSDGACASAAARSELSGGAAYAVCGWRVGGVSGACVAAGEVSPVASSATLARAAGRIVVVVVVDGGRGGGSAAGAVAVAAVSALVNALPARRPAYVARGSREGRRDGGGVRVAVAASSSATLVSGDAAIPANGRRRPFLLARARVHQAGVGAEADFTVHPQTREHTLTPARENDPRVESLPFYRNNMWRVTFTAAGDSQTVPVDPAALAEDVAAILEVELRGAVLAASMAWDGVPVASLPPGTRMSATRVRDGAVVVVTSTKSYASRTPAPSAAAGRLNLRGLLRGGGGGGSRVDPALYATVRRLEDLPPAVLGSVDGLFAVLKANEAVRDDVRRRGDHELLAAAAEATPAKLRALVMSRQLQHVLPAVQERVDTAHLQRRLDADPLDADGQRMLEEMIRRRNVDSNLEMVRDAPGLPPAVRPAPLLQCQISFSLAPVQADDVMPEAQVKVHMLYVAAKVNDAPIKIFVDSGAQMTIITKSAAEVRTSSRVGGNDGDTALGRSSLPTSTPCQRPCTANPSLCPVPVRPSALRGSWTRASPAWPSASAPPRSSAACTSRNWSLAARASRAPSRSSTRTWAPRACWAWTC